MISYLGLSLVLTALLVCAVGAPVGFVAGKTRSARGLALTRRLAFAFALLMLLANLVMEWALVTRDFSVSYVAQVGSKATPLHITIVSLWSSLEGSILFWGLILGLYIATFAYLERRGHEDYMAYALGTMFAVSIFFSFLIAGPANPFTATPAPIPVDGPGPNPLLQNHALMIIHPPTLYFGYVGMTVPFAMAVAALLRGQLGATWLKPLRTWLLIPCAFLSVGIMLGGWWSYEVLGWGGYWAWDPVENASFLPWLTGIAALHSAIVQQRRGTLKAWTVILVMVTFLLTILGTFLTRSGVVNSVHSFTQTPIGPMFLIFLGICLVATVILLSLRVDKLSPEPGKESLFAREGAFLFNNLLLVALMFTVLIGTLFPVAAEAVRGVKVSVGEPYFNRMAVPIFLTLILLMGMGPALPWGRADGKAMRRALLNPLPAAAAGVLLALALGVRAAPVLITAGLAGYTLWVTFDQGSRPARQRAKRGESMSRAIGTTVRKTPRRYGAYITHFGVLMTCVAITISASYQHTYEATLQKDRPTMEAGDYTLTLDKVWVDNQAHLTAQKALLQVEQRGKSRGSLEPALNQYFTQREPLSTPAVRTALTHDLYLTVMNVGRDGSVGLRAIVTPAVMWIWIGVFVMTAGTVMCLLPPQQSAPKPAAGQPAEEAAS